MDAQPGKGLGKGMIIGAWVLLLVLLTLFFSRVLEERENPNQQPLGQLTAQGVREVELKRNPQGHYVATGAINGQPVVFLVDTGATDVAISEKLARKLRLEKRAGGFSHTANGVVAVWQTRLNRVSLGNIELRNISASILPDLKPADQVLLGMSFLKKLEIVQKGDTLTLRQLP
ncbi:retropepsin-like aspartic protease family protein [Thiolapillus brandeum]|uniref:Aspartyl protease family protein n=1 Tax=Thiolapillus brandeum TaxID=1076588 RepID=A0A7U6GKS4_9GAMM|nr:TIGR02281 family clan AA aspartic protease [Thiolapillus brandeum]BAO45387.1 aspartyl protease family protein [Thiolapillus brandeum]